MLLRRVMAHVKTQDWTAIVIDFVIVVAGVFVGIQVSNWNASRIERELMRGHLSEIAEDLRTHLEYNAALEGSARLRISAVDYIHHEAFGTRLPHEAHPLDRAVGRAAGRAVSAGQARQPDGCGEPGQGFRALPQRL